MSTGDIIGNVVALGLLATTIAKVTEAVFGRLYDAVLALVGASPEVQEHVRSTLFLWSVGLGIVLCVRARMGFMPGLLAEPDTYVIAGLVCGAGAGLIWDLALDRGDNSNVTGY